MSRRKSSRESKRPHTSPDQPIGPNSSSVFSIGVTYPLVAAACILLAGLLAYSNSMSGVFIFDDAIQIENNVYVRQLWPSVYFSHPGPRSLGMYTFAINYVLHGLDVWGYHAVNLAIHLTAALLLFGIVRRTLRRDGLVQRYGDVANGIALAVALLWVVHPLQTQAVTYIVQRLESLMGLFYLGSLYCLIRAVESSRSVPWYVASVLCVGVGAGIKEVIVTAPFIMLWYDRAFVSSSWRELLRRRWAYYLAYLLAALPFLPRILRLAFHSSAGAMIGVGSDAPGVWEYLRSQPGVILHYLRLCICPIGQCLDYEWPVATGFWRIVPPGLAILGLLGLTIWCVFRHKEWSFLGGWFFLILAPTSSFVPFIDLAYEHRMYLPSIAVIAALAIGGYELIQTLASRYRNAQQTVLWSSVFLLLLTVVLGSLTLARNRLYHSEAAIWQDAVQKSPNNWRAHFNLSTSLPHTDYARREKHLRMSIELAPQYSSPAWVNLGILLKDTRRLSESLEAFERATELSPDDPNVYANEGPTWVALGQVDRAMECYEKALALEPTHALANGNLGYALIEMGRYDDAILRLQQAIRAAPGFRDARNNLGKAYAHVGDTSRAVDCFEEILKRNSTDYEAHYNLAGVLGPSEPDRAVRHYRAALQINPGFSEAHNNLAVFLEEVEPDQAFRHYRMAIEADPENAQARANLGEFMERFGEQNEGI